MVVRSVFVDTKVSEPEKLLQSDRTALKTAVCEEHCYIQVSWAIEKLVSDAYGRLIFSATPHAYM